MAGQNRGNLRNQGNAAGLYKRFQNVTGQHTIKASAGTLFALIVANSAAAVGTLTLFDGANTLVVVEVPANATSSVNFGAVGLEMPTSILVTPSAATIDCLAVYN